MNNAPPLLGAAVEFSQSAAPEGNHSLILPLVFAVLVQLILLVVLLVQRAKWLRSEKVLRMNADRYCKIIEAQTDLVCRYLPDTTLTFVNEAYCRYFKHRREELIGSKWLELLPESKRGDALSHVNFLIENPGVVSGEHETTSVDGTTSWIQWTDYAIAGKTGRAEEFQRIGRDITDRKRAEEAQQNLAHASRLAVAGELTAMVAHEISQPLSAILSNVEAAEILLKSESPPLDEIREILLDIRTDNIRASETTQRIRTLLRKGEMAEQQLNLNEIVSDVLHFTENDALRRRVHVHKEFRTPRLMIRGDNVHLQQVFLNVVLNGMDAMEDKPESERRLFVSTGYDGNGEAEVTIKDTGHGIPADKLSSIFQPFFTTKENGMGLGLSVARSIIQAHQGHIGVENNPDGGAIFRVTLPAGDPAAEDQRPAIKHQEISGRK